MCVHLSVLGALSPSHTAISAGPAPGRVLTSESQAFQEAERGGIFFSFLKRDKKAQRRKSPRLQPSESAKLKGEVNSPELKGEADVSWRMHLPRGLCTQQAPPRLAAGGSAASGRPGGHEGLLRPTVVDGVVDGSCPSSQADALALPPKFRPPARVTGDISAEAWLVTERPLQP